jgi:hypothetical protein
VGLSERSITSREKLGLPTHRRLSFSEIWSDSAKGTLGKFGFGKAAEYFNEAESFDADDKNMDKVKLHYEGTYEDDEGNEEHDVEGFSWVNKDDYIRFYHKTAYDPCQCDVQGCLSCFLDETNGWADGFGSNVGILWFGNDENGKQWDYGAESFGAEGEWNLKNVGVEVAQNKPLLRGCRVCLGSLGSWDSERRGFVHEECEAESFGAESKCACGCSIGKCGCDEGCKCGCNHKKGGAKWAQAESFEAEVCPCGCAMKGCVCSSSCKGECLNAESFGAESFNDLDYESEQWS